MPGTEDRRSWFGLGGRPRLPAFLRSGGVKRATGHQSNRSLRMRIGRGKRLRGLDEFERPEFVGRMERVARRRKLEWWAMMAWRRRLPWAARSGGG